MANNNHKNNYTLEDVRLLLTTADKLRSHSVMCRPLKFYDLQRAEGREDNYLPTDKSNMRHCIIDLTSILITYCKLDNDKYGEDLLKKYLDMCAELDCDECPKTIEEIENYFTKKAKEIDEDLKRKSYDTG